MKKMISCKGRCTSGWKDSKVAEQPSLIIISWVIQPLHKGQIMLNELMLWFKRTDSQQLRHQLWSCIWHHPWGPQVSQTLCKVGAKAAYRWAQQACMEMCMQFLHQYREGGEAFLQQIIIGNETWMHHYEPASKLQGMQWKYTSSIRTKCAFCWHFNGPILKH